MILDRDLLRALALLVAFGAATTLLAATVGAAPPVLAAAALLLLAGLKAEIILARYLALAAAPAWLRGFRVGVILLLAILFVLWLAPRLG